MNIREVLGQLDLLDPYGGFDVTMLPLDLQGWASEHPYFPTLISMLKPRQIIEVGTWKGASAINMARHATPLQPDVTILCIDTWLGSNAVLWKDDTLRPLLNLNRGYPSLYHQFLANVIHSNFTDTVFPLAMTSICAAELLADFQVQADLVYIDGAHGQYEVYGDLMHYWPLVRPGGIMFGDDYWTTWQGVVTAVNRFAYEQGLALEINSGKWFVTKPA